MAHLTPVAAVATSEDGIDNSELAQYARAIIMDAGIMVSSRAAHGVNTSVLYATLLANQSTFMHLNINNIGYYILRTWIDLYFAGSVAKCLFTPCTSDLWSTKTIFSYAVFGVCFAYKLRRDETAETAIISIISRNTTYDPTIEIRTFRRSFEAMRVIDRLYTDASLKPTQSYPKLSL